MNFILVFLLSTPVFAQLGQQALLGRALNLVGRIDEDRRGTRCNPSDNFNAMVGGIGSCARYGHTTVDDLTCWDRRSPVNFTRELQQSDQLENMSAGFFYQELAGNSLKQAECRSKIIGNFFKDAGARNKMVQRASARFAEMSKELQGLFQYKAELERDLSRKHSAALAARIPFNGDGLIALIDEVKQTITKLLISMPMGYDSDVAKALLKMGQTGRFDAAAYAHAIVVARKKYDISINYFKNHKISGEHGTNFCIDRDFRRAAQKSGQTDAWLDSMPATNRGEKLLRDRLRCRLNATYGKGPARITAAMTVAGIATTIFPLTAVPGMAIKGVVAAQNALKVVSAVNAVSMIMQVELTRRACFGDDFLLTASRNQCNVAGEFEHYMKETSVSGCSIATSVLASYLPMKIPMHIVRYLRRSVSLTASTLRVKK